MVNSASKFDHHAAWRRPSLAQERAAHAVLADLYRRDLRPERGPPSSRPRAHRSPASSAKLSKLVLEFCRPSSCSSPSARCSRWARSSPIVGRVSRVARAWRARGGRLGAGVSALLRAPTARVWVHGAWVRAGAQCACPGRRNGRRAVSPAEVCRAVAGGSLSAACSAASSCHVGRKRPRALAHVTNNRYTRRYTLDTQRRYTISPFRPT